MSRVRSNIIAAIVTTVVGVVALETFYTVDETERAVVLSNGAFDSVAGPGLHYKRPFIDSTIEISIASHKAEFENLEAYSKDQQPATMVVTVTYKILPTQVEELYRRYKSVEGVESQVIGPKVREQLKNTFGEFTAETAISQRPLLNSKVAKQVHEAILGLEAPVEVTSIQVEDLRFSRGYLEAIEERMKARVEAERYSSELDKQKIQASIAIEQSRGRAESRRQEALADADATRLRGEAEAGAIKARAEALGSNPLLVELIKAEKWNGILPSTMIPGGATPMISISK